MTLAVTGGAGFIGANFIQYMLKKHRGLKIVCIDSLTYAGNKANLAPVWNEPDFVFCKADITDNAAMDEIFSLRKPDAVVNFAAESHVDRSIAEPDIFVRTNIMGTQALMNACLKHDVKRFHQISTDEVYGDLPLDCPELRFTESSPIRTSSPYSASKAGADMMVQAYFRTYGLPATISRCSNNYGPYQFPEKLIPLMTINALCDKPLPVYGEGLNVRDWIYVLDHCRAVETILQNGVCGEIYNIGGGCEMRNIDIVRLICDTLHKPHSLIAHVQDRKGHDLRYAIDGSKIQRELGFAPETDFHDGIQRTIEWYVKNQGWWEDIQSGAYRTV